MISDNQPKTEIRRGVKANGLETALLLMAILLIGATFRLVGLRWGEGQPIHPDEEFLCQVTAAVEWPDSLSLYFDTANSPLNPYNRGHTFYVYGTLPLFLTRGLGEWLDRGCTPPYGLAARLLAPLVIGRPVEDCWSGAFSGAGARVLGRSLAALCDLGGLLFIFLAGRRLGSRWTGLLAALLYALSVLPIQQSHFYTTDAYANFFVAATLYLAVCAAQDGAWWAFALSGVTIGLGLACKISVWPLGLLVALAGVVQWQTRRARRHWDAAAAGARDAAAGGVWEREGGRDLLPSWAPLLFVVLAGVIALLFFRIAQPYAFIGPGFFGLRLNPQWLANMAEVQRLMSGKVDTYPNHQWTQRTPLVFPWVNMVFWGLGLPLGLTAWAGWGLAAVDLLRRLLGRRRAAAAGEGAVAQGETGHAASWWRGSVGLLVVWLWGTLFFVYQGAQWVKSIRYLLPVYPAFALLAAWLVTRLWVGWRGHGVEGSVGRPVARRVAAVVVAALVTVGALLWALAFSSIYLRAHTRIAASRWIFEHVPTAATVQMETAGGPAQVQVTIIAGTIVYDGLPQASPFTVSEPSLLTGVTLNYVADPQGDAEPERLRVRVAADASAQQVLAEATQEVAAPAGTHGVAVSFSLPAASLVPDTTYYLIVESLDGGPVQLFSSVLAGEHWDWGPPLRVDGHDPFGGMYRGLSTSSDGALQLYNDDTVEKREQLLDWLDEADYIIIGSNRLYASIPRLPTRYPLTIAYYQALFNGELGFELVADFTSPMALGPIQFPDQEEPFTIPEAPYEYSPFPLRVQLPPAEEAFSVYDHPRVLIFRKTAAYSRARAEALLPVSLLEGVEWVTPRDVTYGRHRRDAMLDEETWAEQRAGGTWSQMFDRQSLVNRSGLAAALVWYLTAALLGWLVFPILSVALSRLRDRGYGLARPVGLLVVGYLTWIAASLHFLPNTRTTILLVFAVLAVTGGMTAWLRRKPLGDYLRAHWRLLLVEEGLFLLLFAFWTWVRSLNPDLWHPVVGGEKPMDFAYLNAVIRSTWFPPYDPWLAGGYLNYYYFGFVLVGTMAKLTAIMPSVAYNLAIAFFFALTGGTAFTVAFNLSDSDSHPRRACVAGLLAVLFMLVLGNLGEVRVLLVAFRTLGGPLPFESTIPGLPQLAQAARGLWQVIRGASLPIRPETPYWDPTRMLPSPAFAEFPAFTFLYGDPHAHMFALPYTVVMLGLALNWTRGQRGGAQLLSLLLGALVVGSLFAGNSWDYPTYLLVGVAGLALGEVVSGYKVSGFRFEPATSNLKPETLRPETHPLLSWLWQSTLLGGLSVLLFRPYIQNYIPAVSGLSRWSSDRIPLDIYLLLIGQFLFPLLTLLIVEAGQVVRPLWRAEGRPLRVSLALIAAGLLFTAVIVGQYVPAAAVAIPVCAVALALLFEREAPVEHRLVWFLLALALGLTLAVELVAVGGDRMNTVFKFYYQVWTFLALTSAAALVWLWERMEGWPQEWRSAWRWAMGVLLFVMALFPAMSIPSKVHDRFTDATGQTLDGMAYMRYSRTGDPRGDVDIGPDYAAIVWLQENVEGSPVIMEGLGAYEYLWGSRVSIYTGLPAVVGWRWHQVQQRMAGAPGVVEQRQADVNECYTTTDAARAWAILRQYDVRYVYVGPYERLYYPAEGLVKFDQMAADGLLRVVYDGGGVRIYERME
jgi:YYY domain-containing protein